MTVAASRTVDLTQLQQERIAIAREELNNAEADQDKPSTYGRHLGGMTAATQILLDVISELTQ